MSNRSPLVWRKSSHSNGGGNCVEVAWTADGRLAFRDSKAPDAGMVLVPTVDQTAMLRTLMFE